MDFYELNDELDYEILDELDAANEQEDQENENLIENEVDFEHEKETNTPADNITSSSSVSQKKKKVTKKAQDKKKTKKKSVDRPVNRFTEEDAVRKMNDYIVSALGLLKKDPVYSNTRYPIAQRVISLAKDLEEHTNSALFLNFWENSTKLVWLSTIQPLLKLMLVDKHKVDLSEESEGKAAPELDKHAEQVVRYVAGYVPYALVKRFSKGKSQTAKAYCKVLSSWQVCSTSTTYSFLSYTKE
ncbi:uncharacterized protein LOC117106474, partial [Anneissia japonica]|uniref:uncharacterized protein LOC117106474 n=1 Tax=Anneissia japonica TaxID=1529436 RepID=UPI001425A510